MYTLYYSPGSANLVVHLALLEAGQTFALKRIDIEKGEQRQPAYLAINPQGVVPTLVVDGKAHAEAAALALLVAERHPQAGLVPAQDDPERAAFLQWLFYLANTLQPLFRQWFFPADHHPEAAEIIKENARRGIEKCWEYLNVHLEKQGDYLLGSRFSLVDLYVLMLMRWSRNMPRPATDWPHLAALATRLKARPAWKKACDAEGLVEWA